MVRPIPILAGDHLGSIPIAIGLFASVSALVALCAKHSRRVSKKYMADTTDTNDTNIAPRSPLRAVPKQLITKISNKAIPLIYHRKTVDEAKAAEAEDDDDDDDEEFGKVGLWQKTILMGEKCQPPEFSGVIYYDCVGNQVSEMPKSPRASPMHTFSFPVVNDSK